MQFYSFPLLTPCCSQINMQNRIGTRKYNNYETRKQEARIFFLTVTLSIQKHKMVSAFVTLSAIYYERNKFWEGNFVYCVFLKPYAIYIQSTQVQSMSLGRLPRQLQRVKGSQQRRCSPLSLSLCP